ncbi:hypothetical protein K488DRAFT_86288 [Vararia minispora EC-137]|uniref:Uncharacterized protein n=1 Tax=Vararia minispora EC-137 TaxID=1314806 RepID=A0ACB8QJX5_9AGAM|nr:hypothetical protein K488DRAFT_86288 [Vararia minispora EC-137]
MSSFVDSTLSCYRNVCADIEELVSHSSLYIDGEGSEWYELFCALRLYAFGSPVRRTSSNAYAPPPPGCIRLRLFSADRRRRGRVLDQVDFRLEPNGGLDVDAVRAYWGIKLLRPCDTATGMVFAPARDDQWSALALHNLTHGKFNKLNVIYVPSAEDEFNPSKGTRPAARRACRQFLHDPNWYIYMLLAFLLFCAFVPYALRAVASSFQFVIITLLLSIRLMWLLLKYGVKTL